MFIFILFGFVIDLSASPRAYKKAGLASFFLPEHRMISYCRVSSFCVQAGPICKYALLFCLMGENTQGNTKRG